MNSANPRLDINLSLKDTSSGQIYNIFAVKMSPAVLNNLSRTCKPLFFCTANFFK
jgi:hypothetical protein